VKRSKRVTLRALNRHGRRVEVEGRGMTANVYQHELDHLDGILFIDRAYRTEKARASRHI
jgi:peptide deformylase